MEKKAFHVLCSNQEIGSIHTVSGKVTQMIKKESATMQETQVLSLGMEDPWRREWQPTPVLLPGEFHGLRSLAGYNPWGHKESDTTELLTQQQYPFS